MNDEATVSEVKHEDGRRVFYIDIPDSMNTEEVKAYITKMISEKKRA